MAKEIEKGATYLDRLCHKFYDEPKGHGERTGYVCRLCGGPLETYYCEERLYLVKCADCGTLALVKTTSPGSATGVTLARPTLTLPNEWVSVEERLPERGKDVLLYFEEESRISVGGRYDVGDGWYAVIVNEYETICDTSPRYWMPLPAPPDRRPPEHLRFPGGAGDPAGAPAARADVRPVWTDFESEVSVWQT